MPISSRRRRWVLVWRPKTYSFSVMHTAFIASAMSSAVPLGASTLALWCFSMISMSNSGSAVAALRTRSSMMFTPRDMLAVLNTGITCAAARMASRSACV